METSENRIPLVRRHNPLTFYLRTLLYMFIALVLRIVAFLPLGALYLFPEGSYFRWLAVLCPILLIFFILPGRFSFAQALVQPARERHFYFDQATSLQNYGEKLSESLLHALHVAKWGIPLLLMLAGGYYFYNNTDAISLLKGIGDLGAGVTTVWCAVANFFISAFGDTQLVPNGGLMEGIYTVGAILGAGLLCLMWGAVRNSAYRYIWALATLLNKNPHAEARRRLRGRRWKQFGVAMINLVLWTPMLFVLFTTFKGVLSDMSNAIFGYLTTKQMNMPELSNALWPLLFAFLVCYMPLLPVRRILTAYFATKSIRHTPMQLEVAPTEIAEVTTTSSGAPEPTVISGSGAEDASQMAAGQAYAPFTQPEPTALNDEADEPTPVKAPEPANQPYPETELASGAPSTDATDRVALAPDETEDVSVPIANEADAPQKMAAVQESVVQVYPDAPPTEDVPAMQPEAEAAASPVAEPEATPTVESVALFTAEPAATPTAEQAAEPVAEPVMEVETEQTAEPAAEPNDAWTVGEESDTQAEEPIVDELEDFFAQPRHEAGIAADDTAEPEDLTNKTLPPSSNVGETDDEQ